MIAEVIPNMVCAQFLEFIQVTGHTSVSSYYLKNCCVLAVSLNI